MFVSRSIITLLRINRLINRTLLHMPLPSTQILVSKFHGSLTEQAQPRSSVSYEPRTNDNTLRALHSFPYAKDILLYLAALLQEHADRNVLQLTIDVRKLPAGGLTFWEAVVSLKWPNSLVFYGKGATKGEATRIACANACASLKSMGLLDRNNKPILYTWDGAQEIKKKRYAPSKITLAEKSLADIENWNRKFFEDVLIFKECEESRESFPLPEEVKEVMEDGEIEFTDLITGEPLKSMRSRFEMENTNDDLYAAHIRQKNSQDSKINAVLDFRKSLPVYMKREEILETIKENQVTLISGETGSGKSTQIPQYLLESLVESNRGTDARIVVTQPRRISAISLAERVAFERNEELGRSVGYQVRLESTLPQDPGCVFFCTTGILLRRLQTNPTLKGVSHVIVDEVHERDVLIDVLLSLLKNAVKSNPDVRVVLMSASFNSDLLSQYFDDCPVVQVEGYLHPVREFFLPEVCKFLGGSALGKDNNDPRTDLDLVLKLIQQIDAVRPEGGILVFLPGWQEIKQLRNRIQTSFYRSDRHKILVLHSMVSLADQHRVFENVGPHQRKIVLATNIAETAITINDIRYVVDVGNQRGQTFNPERGIATLDIQWISKANALQRRGRAGRVRSGECYRLYSRERYDDMEPFPEPEIRRTALEKVILDGKLFCQPTTRAKDFLSQLPEPPELEGIEAAVDELIELRILNSDESLTVMGERAAHFTTHPRLSIALVYAALLRCLNPVLSIASFLTTNRDPFVGRLDNKAQIKSLKERFAGGTESDHIALTNFFSTWLETANNEAQLEEFTESFAVEKDHMKFIDGIRQVLAGHLFQCFLLENVDDAMDQNSAVNEFARNTAFIKAALTAGVGNHVLKTSYGLIKKGRINKNLVITLPETDTLVELSKESVLYDVNGLRHPWLVYHSKFKSGETRKTIVRDVSVVPMLTMVLFGGKDLKMVEKDDDEDVLLFFEGNERVAFTAEQKIASALFELRQNISDLVDMTLTRGETQSDELSALWDSLRELLAEIIPV
ncbi:ATP-dependent RNA helicase DHX30-like [Paramacrobiotus metropolitanus]|uniref:ATP-dependent RNA helicase DHX30-like n=1 Tax=Paramacrobiotus metropolitanus TaxID=2943436 RepID=UPI002445FD4E|nr:ATP-dependent RNA helicase DHX30-like [Paramacrobiotus metropolitanus]